jgi:two-component system, cell cycle sensor histidine kinase and response regulator CckA
MGARDLNVEERLGGLRAGLCEQHRIYLPALAQSVGAAAEGMDPHPLRASAAVSDDAERRGTTILLAEDEEMVRDLIQEVLEDSGYQVRVAADGLEAARMGVEQHGEVDLLVADVVMPGLNGPALAERLRETNPGLRVLFISGYADEELVQHNLRGPGISFLRKPFTPDTLTERVREMLA